MKHRNAYLNGIKCLQLLLNKSSCKMAPSNNTLKKKEKGNWWHTSYQQRRKTQRKRPLRKAFQNSAFQFPSPQGYLRSTNNPVFLWTYRWSLRLVPLSTSSIIQWYDYDNRILVSVTELYPNWRAFTIVLLLAQVLHRFWRFSTGAVRLNLLLLLFLENTHPLLYPMRYQKSTEVTA